MVPRGPLRDILMSRSKNDLPTVSRKFLTRNCPRPNCLLKCLRNCLSPTRDGFLPLSNFPSWSGQFARQLRDNDCLRAIFVLRHQDVSSGSLSGEFCSVSSDLSVPAGEPLTPRCSAGSVTSRARALSLLRAIWSTYPATDPPPPSPSLPSPRPNPFKSRTS